MPAWPFTLFKLAVLFVLPERTELAKTPVEWRISIEWDDASCLQVCAKLDLWCTEECWPRTLEGFKRAMDSPVLRDTCPGFESGGAQPWHPSKDPEGVMCYWFGGRDASLAPRCRQTPSTPANFVADYKIIRRFCPCYNASAARDGIESIWVVSRPILLLPPWAGYHLRHRQHQQRRHHKHRQQRATPVLKPHPASLHQHRLHHLRLHR